jgi:hypothetical protein
MDGPTRSGPGRTRVRRKCRRFRDGEPDGGGGPGIARAAERAAVVDRRKEIASELKALDVKIRRLAAAIEDGGSSALSARLREVEAKRDALMAPAAEPLWSSHQGS